MYCVDFPQNHWRDSSASASHGCLLLAADLDMITRNSCFALLLIFTLIDFEASEIEAFTLGILSSIWNPWMRRYKTVLETRNFLEVTRLSGFGYDHSTDDYVIVSLIVPPDDVVCKKHGFNLCVLGGRLCMINYDHDCHTDIWAWEGNKKGNWIKWMSIPCFEELQSNKYLAPRVLQRLQQQSMTEASEVGVEAKVCRHFLSEIDLHRKSSTPRASLQWTIEQEQCDSQR
ncbi:hypothetical protein JRO89_XS03G0190600 [Xanthoceras sorbifolium]|uniref:F-box associated domain-containing protein n=1 Tax=Xanthoceras sorbifolium TaxID=99658 RepID=A0ABQ8IAM2_9ROSI|nr:hypothetical protein JRO89_XS03G0190600 [Xanthoceras sorbifolium]